jgi:hypothetical protein
VWYEKGQRRQYEAATEDRLAARLDKVAERLATGASNLERPGADLVAFYLSPGRLPVQRQPPRQARAYPAVAVRAVRPPGHRRGPARTR